MSGRLNLPVTNRQSIMRMSWGAPRSRYEGHGLTKPLPCLLWCALVEISDGAREGDAAAVTTAAAIEVIADGRVVVKWKARACNCGLGWSLAETMAKVCFGPSLGTRTGMGTSDAETKVDATPTFITYKITRGVIMSARPNGTCQK